MDFKAILTALDTEFRKAGIRYAIVGGLAVGTHGYARTTEDVDLLVHPDDLARIDRILRTFGYKIDHRTDRFTRYAGAIKGQGFIDFQHSRRNYGTEMLLRARRSRVPAAGRSFPVIRAEDLIGLKAQAFANNPQRRLQDRADIAQIVKVKGHRLQWKRIREYYSALKIEREFEALRKTARRGRR